MKKSRHILANLILYGSLVFLLYDSTLLNWDPWFAFVVGFVLVVALVIQFTPRLHARDVSPGSFPYGDDD